MNLLLDTHSFLWFVNDDPQLSETVLALIEEPTNLVFLSVGSLWEMAIKVSIGKLTISAPFDEFIREQLAINNFVLLDVSIPHTMQVTSLPFHHRDPFDRLLIAQSLVEQIPIISIDTIFDAYGVIRLW